MKMIQPKTLLFVSRILVCSVVSQLTFEMSVFVCVCVSE